MKRLLLIFVGIICSCGDGDNTAPVNERAPDFACDPPTLTGAALTGLDLQKFGVFSVEYTIADASNDIELQLLDSDGQRLYSLELASTPESLIEANTALIMRDVSDDEILREESNVRFIPGLGSQIYTTREVDGRRIHIWNLLTTDRSVGALDVGVESTEPGSIKTPQGQFSQFRAYDPDEQTFASDEALNAWAESVGAVEPVSGELNALKAAVFADATWRSYALAHLATCTTGVQTKPEDIAGLDTPEKSDDSVTVRNALSCTEEAQIAKEQAYISQKLDRLADITGRLGDATVKGLIIANADKFGLKGTINVPGLGPVTITPSDISAVTSFAGALGGGATAALLANPAGILLAGIGAAAYIAARVNDAFGDDIIRWMRETDKPSSTSNDNPPQQRPSSSKARSSGDPHLRTFDGLGYDFMAQGDFILTQSLDHSFAVHVRQKRNPARCADVTYNWGFATQIGRQRVSAYADDPNGTIRIDGELYDVKPLGTLFLEAGGIVTADKSGKISIISPETDVITFTKYVNLALNITVTAAPFRRGGLEGLLGNFNGERDDDLQIPNGEFVGHVIGWDVLYHDFRDAWLVPDDASLLDYEADETPQDYFDPEIPGRPMMIEDLPADEAAAARQTCEDRGVPDISLDICAIDVYCTRDDEWATVHAELTPPDELLVVERPLFLDGWTKQGVADNGDWVVDATGRSVTQTTNGDPTFFVSPQNFINTTIRGRFLNADSDDDFIGFVIGFEGPFAENGDDPNQYKTLLFQWKKRDQGTALAGFTLAKIDGLVTDYNDFWENSDKPTYRVLATDYGQGKAWTNGVEHEFELVYETDRIQIAVDGRRIFDVTAQQAGIAEFPTGRFGFYNYSQAKVTYSNFAVSQELVELGVKEFSIDNFRTASKSLEIKRDATIRSPALTLTPSPGVLAGAVWHRSKIPISSGFRSEFTFRLQNQSNSAGAQGLAFVIQNDDSPLGIEPRGSGLGYSGIKESVAVEFDLVADSGEPEGPHVAVQSLFDAANSHDPSATLGASLNDTFADGQLHWARIDYQNKEMKVFIDDATLPALLVPIDLDLIRLDDGHAHIGFTAYSNRDAIQEIRTWSYSAL